MLLRPQEAVYYTYGACYHNGSIVKLKMEHLGAINFLFSKLLAHMSPKMLKKASLNTILSSISSINILLLNFSDL
jgi:hypothetical protein